ncbi:MAG: class I SAM-dependent methyltransferase, partial [Planctomycetes bacterium]|nr:class I SAM-dependent methyltransferase [Planctomycetota bacterium]
MDRYTQETACWLDLRFDRQVYAFMGREYDPYQPLTGIPDGTWNAPRYLMAARLIRLASVLGDLRPTSFLDVGGAEGMVARFVENQFGAESVSIDLSHQAALRAKEYSGVLSAAADSARLPFADDSFDVVFLSEVIEHLANPVRSVLELVRVAKHAVIITTEAFADTEEARRQELADRRLEPHMDRSILCEDDFRRLLAPLMIT